MKCLLFQLVRSLRFELAIPADQIGTMNTALSRPIVRGTAKVQLPLLVSVVEDM